MTRSWQSKRVLGFDGWDPSEVKTLQGWYVPDIVYGDLHDMCERDCTTYSPSRFLKKSESAFNLNEWTIEKSNDGRALGRYKYERDQCTHYVDRWGVHILLFRCRL